MSGRRPGGRCTELQMSLGGQGQLVCVVISGLVRGRSVPLPRPGRGRVDPPCLSPRRGTRSTATSGRAPLRPPSYDSTPVPNNPGRTRQKHRTSPRPRTTPADAPAVVRSYVHLRSYVHCMHRPVTRPRNRCRRPSLLSEVQARGVCQQRVSSVGVSDSHRPTQLTAVEQMAVLTVHLVCTHVRGGGRRHTTSAAAVTPLSPPARAPLSVMSRSGTRAAPHPVRVLRSCSLLC